MRRSLLVLFCLTLAIPFVQPAQSADCICPLMPMYPVDATNWLHYATVNKTGPTGCTYQYPTAYIGTPMQGRSCATSPNTCGTCSSLGTVTLANADLSFGDPKGAPPTYAELDNPDKIRAFLKANAPSGSNPVGYDDITFSPNPGYSKAVVAKLVDGPKTIYAILWQIKDKGNTPGARSFIGMEISGPIPSAAKVVIPWSVCQAVSSGKNATGTVTHTPIPGLLQAVVGKAGNPGTPNKYDHIAFIQLHKTTASGFKPCK